MRLPALPLRLCLVLVVPLAACGQPSGAPGNSGNAASAEASNAAAAASELAALIDLAVVATRRRLPWKIDDITTMTSIRSRGTEIIYEMTIGADIPAGQIERARQLQQQESQATLCREGGDGMLIRRGASMTHYFTDSTGDRFVTRVTSCPPA